MAVRTWVTPPGRLPVKARVARLPGHVRTDKSVDKSVVSNIFYFHPYLGKIPNLTNIFSDGIETTNQVTIANKSNDGL